MSHPGRTENGIGSRREVGWGRGGKWARTKEIIVLFPGGEGTMREAPRANRGEG